MRLRIEGLTSSQSGDNFLVQVLDLGQSPNHPSRSHVCPLWVRTLKRSVGDDDMTHDSIPQP